MAVTRIVADLHSASLGRARRFYHDVLGLSAVMDHGWIVTVADLERPHLQLNLMTHDDTAPVEPVLSVQVDNLDEVYAAALAAGADIVHPLTVEPWGVRRFFVRDPDGNVVNILEHA